MDNPAGGQLQNFSDGATSAQLSSAQVVQGQIVRNFGMQPPAYWLESLASTPGPMAGGAPILSGNQFSHGVMW